MFPCETRVRELPFTELCKCTGHPGMKVSLEKFKLPREMNSVCSILPKQGNRSFTVLPKTHTTQGGELMLFVPSLAMDSIEQNITSKELSHLAECFYKKKQDERKWKNFAEMEVGNTAVLGIVKQNIEFSKNWKSEARELIPDKAIYQGQTLAQFLLGENLKSKKQLKKSYTESAIRIQHRPWIEPCGINYRENAAIYNKKSISNNKNRTKKKGFQNSTTDYRNKNYSNKTNDEKNQFTPQCTPTQLSVRKDVQNISDNTVGLMDNQNINHLPPLQQKKNPKKRVIGKINTPPTLNLNLPSSESPSFSTNNEITDWNKKMLEMEKTHSEDGGRRPYFGGITPESRASDTFKFVSPLMHINGKTNASSEVKKNSCKSKRRNSFRVVQQNNFRSQNEASKDIFDPEEKVSIEFATSACKFDIDDNCSNETIYDEQEVEEEEEEEVGEDCEDEYDENKFIEADVIEIETKMNDFQETPVSNISGNTSHLNRLQHQINDNAASTVLLDEVNPSTEGSLTGSPRISSTLQLEKTLSSRRNLTTLRSISNTALPQNPHHQSTLETDSNEPYNSQAVNLNVETALRTGRAWARPHFQKNKKHLKELETRLQRMLDFREQVIRVLRRTTQSINSIFCDQKGNQRKMQIRKFSLNWRLKLRQMETRQVYKQAMQSRVDAILCSVPPIRQNFSKRSSIREEKGHRMGHRSPSPIPLGSSLHRIQRYAQSPHGQNYWSQKRHNHPKLAQYLLLQSHETTSAGTESEKTHDSQKLSPDEEAELNRWENSEKEKLKTEMEKKRRLEHRLYEKSIAPITMILKEMNLRIANLTRRVQRARNQRPASAGDNGYGATGTSRHGLTGSRSLDRVQFLMESSTNFRGLPRFHRIHNQHNSKIETLNKIYDEVGNNFEDTEEVEWNANENLYSGWGYSDEKEEDINCSHAISFNQLPEIVDGVQRSLSACSGHSIRSNASSVFSAISRQNLKRGLDVGKLSLSKLATSLVGLEVSVVKRFIRALERRKGKMVTLDASVITCAKWRHDIFGLEHCASRLPPNGLSSYFSFFPLAYESDIEENYDDRD